jgi:aryl-alcohol dehydrogenase-like predicted oxidoreductase
VAAVKTVSDDIGHSMAQVALARLSYRPDPVIPIIGAQSSPNYRTILPASPLTFQQTT